MAGPLLEVAGLKRSFGGFQALGGVSFRVEAGEISAVIGPTARARRPCSMSSRAPGAGLGTGRLCRPGHHRPAAPRDLPPRAGALVSAHQYLSASLRLRERADRHSLARAARLWLLDGAQDLGRDRTMEILEDVGLASRAADPSGSLSYGDQKQLELGIALALEPTLLLLDEPTAACPRRRPGRAWPCGAHRARAEAHRALHRARHGRRLLGGAEDPRAPPGAPHRGRRARGDPGPREVKRVYFGEGAIRTRRAP